jgi:hypothetical protein
MEYTAQNLKRIFDHLLKSKITYQSKLTQGLAEYLSKQSKHNSYTIKDAKHGKLGRK